MRWSPYSATGEATPARSADSARESSPFSVTKTQCRQQKKCLKEKLLPVLPSVPRMRQWGQMTSTHAARRERSPLLGEPIRDGQKALHLCACAACLVWGCALCRDSGKDNQTRRQWSLCWKVVQMQKEGWFADERKEGRTGGLVPQVSSLSSGESRTLLTWGLGGAAGEETAPARVGPQAAAPQHVSLGRPGLLSSPPPAAVLQASPSPAFSQQVCLLPGQ